MSEQWYLCIFSIDNVGNFLSIFLYHASTIPPKGRDLTYETYSHRLSPIYRAPFFFSNKKVMYCGANICLMNRHNTDTTSTIGHNLPSLAKLQGRINNLNMPLPYERKLTTYGQGVIQHANCYILRISLQSEMSSIHYSSLQFEPCYGIV